MPPVLVVVVGAIGVFAAAKWIAREARRINAELHPDRYGPSANAQPQAEPVTRLRRDRDGVYRPD